LAYDLVQRQRNLTEFSVQPNQSIQKSYVSLKLPRPVALLVTYVQSVLAAMTNNPHFPSPTPPLATILAAVTALLQAEAAALARTRGAVVVRNDAKAALVTLMHQLQGYIQTTADADPENGGAIIQSSGLPARKMPTHPARVFAVKTGALSGSVDVVAPTAARRASYEWEYSLDGGKTWVDAGPSLQAKKTISALPVGTSVQFRFRGVTKAGPLDWSQPLALMVK
jgi:hypothetical protein